MSNFHFDLSLKLSQGEVHDFSGKVQKFSGEVQNDVWGRCAHLQSGHTLYKFMIIIKAYELSENDGYEHNYI
jgi:hypothetical protein